MVEGLREDPRPSDQSDSSFISRLADALTRPPSPPIPREARDIEAERRFVKESLRAVSSSSTLRKGFPVLGVASYAAAHMLDYREELRSWGKEAYGETREFLRDIYHIGRRADPQMEV